MTTRVEFFTETGTALMLQLEEETKRWGGEQLTGVQRGAIEIAFEKVYAFARRECRERQRKLVDAAERFEKHVSGCGLGFAWHDGETVHARQLQVWLKEAIAFCKREAK